MNQRIQTFENGVTVITAEYENAMQDAVIANSEAIALKADSTATETALAGKVDKVTGKGLSENDFTDALKTKLDGVEAGANATVIDAAPTENSSNAVSSGGAFNAERYNREVGEVSNWLVDYNYFDAAVESSDRYEYMKIGIDRKKTRFVFNCQYDLGYAIHAKLSNALERASSTSSAKAWGNGFDVKAGHLYHIIMKHISGSVTLAEGVSYPSLRVYTLGSSSDASVERGYVDDDTYILEYYANADATVNIVLYVSAHTQFDSYTVEIIMEDVTHAFSADKRVVTPNIEYSATASKNYSIGKYLILGQKLYKTTAAIAEGEAITPGTNVSETTVMGEISSLAQTIN